MSAIIAAYGLLQLFQLVRLSPEQLAVYNLGIDTRAYLELGRQAALQGPAAIPPTHPPGFISYLAVLFSLSPDGVVLAKALNVLFVVLVAFFTFRIGYLRCGHGQGVIAALLVLCSPGLRAYAATLQYEVFAMALVWAAVWLWVEGAAPMAAHQARSLQILSMILLAAATLTREPLALLFPALFLGEKISRHGKGLTARRWTMLALIFLTPLLSWVAWQYHAHGVLVPISAKSAINFQVGFNPQANGSFNVVRSGIGVPNGLDFVLEQPGAAAGLVLRKVGYLWGVLRDGWNVPREATLLVWALTGGRLEYRLCLRLTLVLPALIFVAGLLLLVRTGRAAALADMLFALLFTTLCYSLPFFGSYRFLLPVFPAVFLVMAEALLVSGRLLGRIPGGGVVGGAALCILALVAPRFPFDFHVPTDWLDGVRVQTVVRPGEGPELVVPAERDPRLAALFPAEYLPGGDVELLIRYGAVSLRGGEVAIALLRTPEGRPHCEVALMPAPENSPLRATCALPHLTPVSLEIHARGDGELRVQSVVVRRPE